MPSVTEPAECAICQRSIIRQQRFVLAGSEAVHVECARAGGKTINWRLREALEQHRVALRDLARARETDELRMRELESRLEGMSQLRRALEHSTAKQVEVRAEIERAIRARDEALIARDAAQRELALHQTLIPNAPIPPRLGAKEGGVTTDGDDASIRFSLLELDPP